MTHIFHFTLEDIFLNFKNQGYVQHKMDFQYNCLAYQWPPPGLLFPSLPSWINTYTSCKTQLNHSFLGYLPWLLWIGEWVFFFCVSIVFHAYYYRFFLTHYNYSCPLLDWGIFFIKTTKFVCLLYDK